MSSSLFLLCIFTCIESIEYTNIGTVSAGHIPSCTDEYARLFNQVPTPSNARIPTVASFDAMRGGVVKVKIHILYFRDMYNMWYCLQIQVQPSNALTLHYVPCNEETSRSCNETTISVVSTTITTSTTITCNAPGFNVCNEMDIIISSPDLASTASFICDHESTSGSSTGRCCEDMVFDCDTEYGECTTNCNPAADCNVEYLP